MPDARPINVMARPLSVLHSVHSPRWRRVTMLVIAWLAVTSIAQAQVGDGRAVPRQDYFLAFQSFNVGEYRDALKGFRSAANSGINTGAGRWVDSICYYTMTGECFYHMGNLSAALDNYDVALQLVIARHGWLKRIQIPPLIGPSSLNTRITWGPSTRNAVPGAFPDPMLSMQGTDLDTVLRQGGTVAPQELYPVRVVEIMRCIALSLRRRREILGPVASQLPLTNQIVKELSSRQLQPNVWFQTLVDVQLGIAKAAAGDVDEALTLLQRSLVVNGRFDHPLTAIALLEIGELSLAKNDLNTAQQSFFEASFPAAYFGQADALEEALVGAARIHTLKSEPGIFVPLAAVAEWSRVENLDRAAAAMLLAGAEQSLNMNDVKQASGLISRSQQAMGRSDLRSADLGVQLAYLNAQLFLESGDTKAGLKTLQQAVTLHQRQSKRLFQLDLVNRLYAAQELSSRVAGLLFEYLLREPTSQDWQQDRYETLVLELTPHLPALERWLEIATDRGSEGNLDTVVLVSDSIRRHKFFSRLPLAGRMLALRWVLEAPSVLLSDEVRNQRQNLFAKYPELAERSRKMEQLKAELSQLPVVPETPEEGKAYERAGKELARVADEQEVVLQRLALRADPATRMFPPLLTLEEIQARQPDGLAILAFVTSGRSIYAVLLTPDKRYTTWLLESPAKMRKDLAALLREIGNYDAKQVLPADRLTDEAWKDVAAQLFEPLAKELSVETLAGLKHLVIVPDGFLWHLPFEMLQVGAGAERKALMDWVQVSYAPTLGLAVPDTRPQQTSGPRVIVHGRLFSRETGELVGAAAEQLQQQKAGSTILRRRLPYATRYVASFWQQLIVLDDIEAINKDALGWSPAQIDQGKPGGALAEWLALPWGAPDVVVLPGYSTAAEEGIRRQADGDDLLLATCGLMAAGTRTILISRWRTGGRVSMELLREFLQEMPQLPPATAWQRSLLLARSSELDPAAEPRLKNVTPGDVPSADHPFFWAGFMLMSAR